MGPKIVVFEPDGIYRTIIENILLKNNYRPYFVDNSAECKVVVDEIRPDIIIIDIRAAKPHDFRILADLKVLSKAPVLLTTEENVDDYMTALGSKNVTIVLPKPIKGAELSKVLANLLTVDPRVWFGIHNYIPDLRKLRKMKLKRSTQVRTCIKTILNEMHAWGFNFNHETEMDLVWQEILINAVYHAHGYTNEKKERVAIELPQPYEVEVTYGASEHAFGIAVRDSMGTLTPSIIIEALRQTVEQQKMIEKAAETGEDISHLVLDRGRGLDLIRQLSGEYYFIIDPGVSTEVIIIYDRYYEKDDAVGSLKIFDLSYHLRDTPVIAEPG
ncbi:MAG TPA: ATP-binding protein [Turneriella sp.]|nr:ATP-binding protein [Turneriella sp.]HMY10073.1 ATP-binding protein [Turneriella sp.]HNE20119.1 ATP-binding protein [Turneriella sp.]HNJ65455.1 ATP-binding protein [Turneriella sp.]HNL11526.1 ATP-binding protein [Turneriella sp.]